MEVIRLEQGWQMRMFDCGEAQGWEELKSAFVPSLENVQRVYEVKHFPAQVHDVLLACGIIKNPNIRGRNQDHPFFSSSPCFTFHSFWERST